MTRRRNKDSLVWGIILIVLGVIFILDNADIEVWHYVGQLWPLIFILWGGWKIYLGLQAKKEAEANSVSGTPEKTDRDLK